MAIKTLYRSTIIVLWSVLLLASVSAAGAVSREAVGKNLSPFTATPVELVKETVMITLYPDQARVQSTFYLENPGSSTRLKAGIPLASEADLLRFEAWVNGAPAKVNEGADQSGEFYGWKFWDLSFEPNETKTVKLSYVISLDGSPYVHWLPEVRRAFTYLLKTGRNWGGKIGEAKIQIRLKGVDADKLIAVAPDGYQLEDGVIHWELISVEPEENIMVSFRERAVRYPDDLSLVLKQSWKADIFGDAVDSFLDYGPAELVAAASNYASDGHLYGRLRAVDARNGQVRWQTGDLPEIVAPPFVGETLVVVLTRDGPRAFEAKKGGLKWSLNIVPLESIVSRFSSFFQSEGVGYFAAASREICAVDLKTGKLRWRTGLPDCPVETYPELKVIGLETGQLYLAGLGFVAPSKVWALSTKDGQTRWTSEITDVSLTSGDIADGKIFVGGMSFTSKSGDPALPSASRVVALSQTDGEKLWEKELESPETGIVVSAREDKVLVSETGNSYLFDNPKKLWVLNGSSGQISWEKETEGALRNPPFISDDAIYLGSADGHLLAFDAGSGQLRWRYQNQDFGEYVEFWPLGSNGQPKFFGLGMGLNNRGLIYAFEPTGQDGSVEAPPTVFKVVAGVFSAKDEARKKAEEISRDGLAAWVEPGNIYGNFWRVVCGRFTQKDDAQRMVSKLKAQGFKAASTPGRQLNVTRIPATGRYTVLAGQSDDLREAVFLVSGVLDAGARAWLERSKSGRWEVIAGRFDELREAIAVTEKLTAAGFKTSLRGSKPPVKVNDQAKKVKKESSGNRSLVRQGLYALAISLFALALILLVYAFSRPEKRRHSDAPRVARRENRLNR